MLLSDVLNHKLFYCIVRNITELIGLEGTSGDHPFQPPARQGHLEPMTQECLQVGFECLQNGRLHNLPGQPVPVLFHP